MTKSPKSMDMVNGSLADKILLFALPLMLSSMLQLLFNAVDVVVVGRYVGKEALAAVGSTTSLINLLVALFVGLSVGTNVVVARNLGAKNYDAVSRSTHGALLLAAVSGLVMGAIGLVMSRQFLVWMSSPSDVIDLSTQYLKVYFLGMPALMVYNFGAAILRANGDTRRPLYYLSFAGITNVTLNLFFVIVFQLSVTGVALATIISQYISAGLVVRCLMRETGPLHLDLQKLRLDWYVAEKILSIGIPAGLQSIIFSLSNVVIQSTINSFDSDVMSGAAAANSLESFIYIGMNAFHQSALTFIGQNYGAKKPQRIDRTVLFCLSYVMATGLVLGNLLYLNGHFLLGLYIPGEETAIAAGLVRLAYVGRFHVLSGLMDVMVGILRGLGKSVIPTAVTLLGVCGLRLAWVYYVFPLNATPNTLFLAYPVTWAFTGVTLFCMFLLTRKSTYRTLIGSAE